MRVTDLICGAPPNPYRNGISNPLIDGLSTTIADNYPVPPKSCRPQKVRENLPQSFHSLAVSEPDPITLFTPYILSVSTLSNDHATKMPLNSHAPAYSQFPCKKDRNKKFPAFSSGVRGNEERPRELYIFNTQ